MKTRIIIGWISISISIMLICMWAFWGIIENFHEGWYFDNFFKNIGLMFIQYLSPLIITTVLTLISIKNNKIGALLFITSGIVLSFYVSNSIISIPFIILAILYWFSNLSPKKWKYILTIIIPFVVLIIFGIEPIYRLIPNTFGK